MFYEPCEPLRNNVVSKLVEYPTCLCARVLRDNRGARCRSSVGKYARFELVEDLQLILRLRLVQSDGRVAVTSVCKSGLVDRMIIDSAGLSSRELLSDT
jgi:hypothetical protein